MNRYWFFGVLAALCAFGVLKPSPVAATQAARVALAASAEEEMEEADIPGMAYAILKDGQTQVVTQGMLQQGGSAKVTPDTPFLLGSVSKSFTALAVMQLVEAGQVELDQPIGDYLSDFASKPAGKATIRQLLSHTSGFSTLQGNQGHDAAQLAGEALAYAPATQWDYSNANYVILGALIEQVSGQSYGDYMAAHIFAPLGMDHSSADGIAPDGAARGHLPWFFGRKLAEEGQGSRATVPAGGIYSSAKDMAAFLAMMLNGQDDVLSAKGKAQMLAPASDASPFYGLGWFLDSETGSATHEGTSPGMETLAGVNLGKGTGAIVLTNAGSGFGYGETGHVRYGIVNAAIGEGEGISTPSWGSKMVFLTLLALPFFLIACIGFAWWKRAALRAKLSSKSGLFSLWFPLASMGAMAWVFIALIPSLFGVSLTTLHRYSPDLAILLAAGGVLGIIWAVVRLGIAYGGRRKAT